MTGSCILVSCATQLSSVFATQLSNRFECCSQYSKGGMCTVWLEGAHLHLYHFPDWCES